MNHFTDKIKRLLKTFLTTCSNCFSLFFIAIYKAKGCFLFFIFACSFNSFSQSIDQKKIDSLKNVVENIKDEKLKISVLLELSRAHQSIKISESEKYSEMAYKLIKKNKLNSQLGNYWHVKAEEHLLKSDISKANDFIKKAENHFLKEKRYDKYIDAVIIESKIYLYSGDIKKSKACIKSLIQKHKNTKYQSEIANSYIMLAIAEASDSKLINAIDNLEKALLIFRKTNNRNGILECYGLISQFHISTQTYDKALIYAKKAMNEKSFEKSEQTLSSEHLTLAMIYYYSKKYLKASDEIDKSILKANNIGDELLNNKIIRYYVKINAALKNNDKLIKFCTTKLKHFDENSDMNFILYYGLSSSYFEKKQYDLSKKYNTLLLNLLQSEDKYAEAYINYDLSLYELFAKTESKLKNYSLAYLYQTKYTEMNDEFVKNQNISKVLELQEAFNSNQKDLALKDLTISEQKQKLEIVKQKNFNSRLFIFIVFIIVALSIVFIAFINNKKKNNLLHTKNKIISEKIAQVEEQKTALSKSLEERELLLKEIHHRVKNNLQVIMSLLNIQAKEGVNPNIEDFLEKAQSRVSSMSLIHQSLYENEQFDRINFEDYLTKLTRNLVRLFGVEFKHTSFKIDAKDIFLDIQTAIPLGLILNELLSNSFKHAFSNFDEALISIDIKKIDEKQFIMVFSDNGKGYSVENLTANSLGLELVKLLAKQLKGSIEKQNSNETSYTMYFKEIIN